MVDDDTVVLDPVSFADLETPTMQIPIVPGPDMPWVEPRRWAQAGPVWDATDEIYITYNEEGERALVTTGERDIWNREHNYQRTGSARYEQLAELAGRVGDRARAAGRRLRPRWVGGGTREWPEVHPDRAGFRPGRGPSGGARDRAEDHGTGAHGSSRHARDRADRSGVPIRPHQQRVRSHRHCPGCSGHGGANHSGAELVIRALTAWVVGWIGVWAGDFGLSVPRYGVITLFAFLIAILWRPVWRELVNYDERFTKGGRR